MRTRYNYWQKVFSRQDKRFKGLMVVALFFILCLIFYKNVIFSKDRIFTLWESDIFHYGFSFNHLAFGGGDIRKISFWNPYIFLGMPLITHPGNALFYPFNLLFFLLPVHLAFNYSFILNTLLSGIAIYLYVRYLGQPRFGAFISAIVFMFNAVALLHAYAGHLQTLQTLPWLPLIFLFTEMFIRKREFTPAIFGGVMLGIQILAGNAQYTFYTLLAVGAYFLFMLVMDYLKNRNLPRAGFYLLAFTVMVLVGCGIAAVKLFPSLEFMKLSNRSATKMSFVKSLSFPPLNLVTYLFPEFYGDIVGFPYWGLESNLFWEMCGYMGILSLVFGLVAITYNRNRYSAFFTGLAAFSLLGALGKYTPLNSIFYHFLPGFNKFRGHGKLIVLFAFCFSVLCGFGINWILETNPKTDKKLKRIAGVLGVFAGLFILLIMFVNLNKGLVLPWWMRIWEKGYWATSFIEGSFSYALFSVSKFTFFILGLFLVLVFWMKGRIGFKLFKFLIFALVFLDLWLFGSKYMLTDKVEKCYWDRKVVSFLKNQGQSYNYRVVSLDYYNLFPNAAILDGIQLVDGYESIFLKRYFDLFSFYYPEAIDSPANIKLLGMVNLKFILAPKHIKFTNPALSVVSSTEKFNIWRNDECLPRSYIVHGAKIIKNNEDRLLYYVLGYQFQPLNTVVLEEDAPVDTGIESLPQQPGESIEFLKYTDNEIIIKAVLKKDGYLVLSDLNYPGWRAEILNLRTGGHKDAVPLYANYLFRTVGLETGEYSVKFTFRPRSLYVGLLVTILIGTIVAVTLVFLRLKIRNALK